LGVPLITVPDSPYTSDSDRDEDKKGKKKMEKKKYYKKKGGEAHMGREWDSYRNPSTPPPTRTPPTLPSSKAFSSPTLVISVSWLRTTRRRRCILEIPPNTLHLMMRVPLVIIMMI
jgi:hypothetical protein